MQETSRRGTWMKRCWSTLLVFAGLAWSTNALAQGRPWLGDRSQNQGPGIRTGNLEIHPGAAAEVGYDTNYFQGSGTGDEPEVAAYRLRITPSIYLTTLGAQRTERKGAAPKLTFRGGGFLSYNELMSAEERFAEQVAAQRHLDAGAELKLNIMPQGKFGGDVYGDFLRTAEASNRLDPERAWDRDSFRLGAGVTWRPGGGLFDWRLGYELRYHIFERDQYANLNNMHHIVGTRGRYRFRPRTALIYDAELGFVRYTDASATQNEADTVRSRLGVKGLVTNQLSLMALGGWSASFYESTAGIPARNYDTFVAHLEGRWYFSAQPRLKPDDAMVGLSSLGAGFVRTFANSYLGDFYGQSRGYVDFSYFIGGRVLLDFIAGYTRIFHPAVFFQNGEVRTLSFVENRVDAQLFAEYRLSDMFGVNTTLRYDTSLGENRVGTNPNDADERDNLAYSRFQAWLGVRWFM